MAEVKDPIGQIQVDGDVIGQNIEVDWHDHSPRSEAKEFGKLDEVLLDSHILDERVDDGINRMGF